MELLTERVPTRRVLRGDDGAPVDGDCVLAIATRWHEQPLSLIHVKPGEARAITDGLDVRWENGLPVLAARQTLRSFIERAGQPATEVGRLIALEAGDTFLAQTGDLTIEARLQRRSERAPEFKRREGFFFGLVVAHSLMLMTAALVAMVITPVVGEESMFGKPSVLRSPPTAFTQIPKVRAPELQEKVESAVKVASMRPTVKTPKKSTAENALKLLFGGGGGGKGVFVQGVNQIDAALDALGKTVGSNPGGMLGLSARDTGVGGPGVGLSLGKLGPGRGPGDGPGVGLKGKRTEDIVCANCTPTLGPGYDRTLVLKVVRKHQSEIRYCYESELNKNPSLGGKVTVAWTIGSSGKVEFADIAESGLNNADVESCIVSRIRRWDFPEPAGGQEVAITFPWVFQVAGSEE